MNTQKLLKYAGAVALGVVGIAIAETLDGSDEGDELNGGGAPDTIKGNKGGDQITGGGQSDKLYGGPGADTIFGGHPDDTESTGDDEVWDGDGKGPDGARDTIVVEDGAGGDIVHAGPEDHVDADPGDRVYIHSPTGGLRFAGTYEQYEKWKGLK